MKTQESPSYTNKDLKLSYAQNVELNSIKLQIDKEIVIS